MERIKAENIFLKLINGRAASIERGFAPDVFEQHGYKILSAPVTISRKCVYDVVDLDITPGGILPYFSFPVRFPLNDT